MSRLKDALMSLLGKCTPTGTEPVGNNVDEILECISKHYNGGQYVINFTWGADYSITSDTSVSDAFNAFKEGKRIVGRTVDGMLWQLVQATEAEVILYSITGYTANSLQYTVVSLPSKAGDKCGKQTISLS